MKDKVMLGLKIFLLVLIAGWIVVVVVDYFNARNDKNPSFCLKQEYHVYNASGSLEKTYSKKEFDLLSESEQNDLSYTSECIGLGYKIYRYHREFHAVEFGPFFISERQSAK